MTRRGLTPRKRELIGHIAGYKAEHKKAPSHADIARLMECRRQNVTRMVAELVEQGILAKTGAAQRNIKVLP